MKRLSSFGLKNKESLHLWQHLRGTMTLEIWWTPGFSYSEKWGKLVQTLWSKLLGLGLTLWVWLLTSFFFLNSIPQKTWQCVPSCWWFFSESSYSCLQQSRQAHFSYMHYKANIVIQLAGKNNLSHTMIFTLFSTDWGNKIFMILFSLKKFF